MGVLLGGGLVLSQQPPLFEMYASSSPTQAGSEKMNKAEFLQLGCHSDPSFLTLLLFLPPTMLNVRVNLPIILVYL